MPTGKHDNHRGGRPRRRHKSKLVAVHFASDSEEAEYMKLTPRQRCELVRVAKTIASHIDLSEYDAEGDFARCVSFVLNLSQQHFEGETDAAE